MKNNIEFQKEYAIIVGGGKYGGRFIIDLDMVDKINKLKWNLATSGGVQAKVNGKINFFLNIFKPINMNKSYGQESHCYINAFRNELLAIDSYIRRRLRVAMIHAHPTQRKGWAMSTKWNNEYFARIGLIPAFWLYINYQTGSSLENYIQYMKDKG